MADDYTTWRPQAEAEWSEEEYRVKFERLGAAGDVYFQELRTEIARLVRQVVMWQTEVERERGRAMNILEDLKAALRERDTYVDMYRAAAGLQRMERGQRDY